MPRYFLGVYVDTDGTDYYKNAYSILNAGVVSFFGLASALSGGIISDHYENKGIFMAKSYVCMFAGALGIPTMMGCTLI
jgi:hypothetical protein